MATLVICRGDSVLDRIELGRRDLRIGRAPENEIALPDPGKAVSRFHAELRYENGQYVLLDLNSSNGLWIDGRRVQREPLSSGVAVTIGPYRVLLEGEAGAVPAEPPPAPSAPTPAQDPDTLLVAGGRHATPTPVQARPVARARRLAARPQAASAPGLIGWLARLPRSLLFVGSGAILVLIIIAGLIVNRQPGPGASTPTAGATAQESAPPVESRPGEAPDLKTRAEEALRTEQRAASLQSPSPSAEMPGQPGPPASADASPVLPAGGARDDRPIRAEAAGGRRAAREGSGRGGTVRERELQSRYDAARAMLEGGDYQAARRALAALVDDAPEFLDVAALLEQARNAERQANRAAAAAAVVEGNRLFDSGDAKAAFDAYERAQRLDAAVEGAAAGSTRARQRMRELGEDAFKRARQYDAVGRASEALALYERAVQLLPEDHANRAVARDRAAALKGIAR